MIFKEFGDRKNPTIVLLHGGGLSWWSFLDIIPLLKEEYHIVTPIIDGHGEDSETTFVSIQDSAQKLLQYIDENFGGRVYAVCGLSLGAQIAVELLSRAPEIAKFAVIESALVVPLKGIIQFTGQSVGLFYGLIRYRWFAKMQSKALCVRSDLFEEYFKDSRSMSRKSLENIIASNAAYTAPETLRSSTARALIIIGSEEKGMMGKSVRKLAGMLPQAQVYLAPRMKHGELSLAHGTEYLAVIKNFMI